MRGKPVYARRIEKLANACFPASPNIPWISASQFLDRNDQKEWAIVDVRSPRERAVSVIPRSTSLEDFEAQSKRFTDRPILVYCTVGCRSGAYTQKLREQGFDAFNLRGGVLAWALEGKEFVTPNGRSTHDVHIHGAPQGVLPPGYKAVR